MRKRFSIACLIERIDACGTGVPHVHELYGPGALRDARATGDAMLLNISQLRFSYRHEPVLRDVSLQLNAGEVLALVGPNGVGKSTLLRCALGQFKCTGDIRWNDRPLANWPRRELARTVAYLPQTPTFEPGLRVSEAIAMGRTPHLGLLGVEGEQDVVVVRQCAERLGLTELLDRTVDTLSGGQRQRVLVARCLAQEPQAVLLDEPDTFLDLKHRAELGAIVRQLTADGLGVLLASHDLNWAAGVADRMLVLHDGVVAAIGTPQDVMQPDVLEPVYGVPLVRHGPLITPRPIGPSG